MKNLENKRLHALDVVRGLTIILMIIVNTPGSWSHVYAPLLHAEWNGITPTDYVFPSFLFIVGVSIALSFSKQKEQGKNRTEMTKKVLLRSVKIYAVGIFLWLWPSFNFEGIRWVGVLPRIAFVYLACALLFFIHLSQSTIVPRNRPIILLLDCHGVCSCPRYRST